MKIKQLIYVCLITMLLTSCATEGDKNTATEASGFNHFVFDESLRP